MGILDRLFGRGDKSKSSGASPAEGRTAAGPQSRGRTGADAAAHAPSQAPADLRTHDGPRTSTPPLSWTVREGDSLSKIAVEVYGDSGEWRRIYEANRSRIDDPDLIHPGQQLEIPAIGHDRPS